MFLDTSELLNIVVGLDDQNISTSAECFAQMNLGTEQEISGKKNNKYLEFGKKNDI